MRSASRSTSAFLTRRLNSTKHLRLGADETSPVEHDGAKMNIE